MSDQPPATIDWLQLRDALQSLGIPTYRLARLESTPGVLRVEYFRRTDSGFSVAAGKSIARETYEIAITHKPAQTVRDDA